MSFIAIVKMRRQDVLKYVYKKKSSENPVGRMFGIRSSERDEFGNRHSKDETGAAGHQETERFFFPTSPEQKQRRPNQVGRRCGQKIERYP